MGGGLGFDGGMADYMLVPSARFLVPLGSLSPAAVGGCDKFWDRHVRTRNDYVSCNSEREQCELPLNEKARARRIDLIGGTDGNTVG